MAPEVRPTKGRRGLREGVKGKSGKGCRLREVTLSRGRSEAPGRTVSMPAAAARPTKGSAATGPDRHTKQASTKKEKEIVKVKHPEFLSYGLLGPMAFVLLKVVLLGL